MRRGDAPGQVRGGPQFQLEIIMEIHVRGGGGGGGGGGDGDGIYFGFTARTLIRTLVPLTSPPCSSPASYGIISRV